MNDFSTFILTLTFLLLGVVQDGASAAEPEVNASKPARNSGMVFQIVSPAVWALPNNDERTPISLALKITNQTDKELKIETEGSLTVTIQDAAGKELSFATGQDAVPANRKPAPPLVVPKGKSVMLDRSAQLQFVVGAGNYRLVGSEGAGFWVCDGLHAGKYTISITFENSRPEVTDKTKPVNPNDPRDWLGKVTTEPLTINIVEKPAK